MENESPLSSPEPGLTDLDSPQASNRRKSGRVSRKPEFLSQSYIDSNPGGAKRKRDAARDEDEEEDVDENDASESEEISDEEPDEEELREKRRAARKASAKKASSGTKSKKTKSQATHAAKRPKVAGNGVPSQLAIRPAVNGKKTVSRPRKVKPRPSLAAGQSGLYGRWLASSCFQLAHRLTMSQQRRSLAKTRLATLLLLNGLPSIRRMPSLRCTPWLTSYSSVQGQIWK
jgi:cohesin complex subunit SA-1/2